MILVYLLLNQEALSHQINILIHESQRFNKHQNNYSSTNVSNYSKANSNHQSRVKLQSERFKSNYHLSSEPTYHRSSFKTSEVPSAILELKSVDQSKTV